MYEYLIGTIMDLHPDYIVLEVQGIGYRIQVANPYSYSSDQSDTKVYIYQSVRDDDISLFGFHSLTEKQLFEKLLNVSGIGPKSALAILANPDHQGLVEAIANNNTSYLSKFPGIGKKTASRIVIELQDKVDSLLPTDDIIQPQVARPTDEQIDSQLADALAALKALGYTEKDVKKVRQQLIKQDAKSTDEYLRQGLTLLS